MPVDNLLSEIQSGVGQVRVESELISVPPEPKEVGKLSATGNQKTLDEW